ncbi:MAG: ABC transporter substrate-binding protein, partial [Thermicanus sp.]|nr:ABC transporter substrate-binding protein [Thermicanus sp.]
LADFEAKYPNIKVKFDVIQDQYMDVMKTRLVGGEAGDVFFLDSSEAPGLIQQGILEPLNPYVTDDFDVADFEEPLLNAFKQGDTYYGFPKDYSTLGLFYNKKMFAEAGIKEPPKTWDELRAVSKQLTKDTNGDGKIDQYGLGVAPELARQYFMVLAYGGKVVDENHMAAFATPEGIQGLQLVIDQYRKDKTSVQPSDVGGTWGGDMFGQGKVAMVIEGPWAIPYLQDTFKDLDFGIAEVPTVNGKNQTMAYTVAYVMNAASQHKKEAWALISYLTGKEGMKTWTSLGIALPTRKSVAAELGLDKDPLRAPLVAGARYAIPWQAGPYLPTIMNNFNNQFVSAFLGQQDLASAMKKAQETANKEIEAAK